MNQLNRVWICKACAFQNQLRNLPNFHDEVNFCPKCKERGELSAMMTIEKYQEEQRRKELEGKIYCRDCGYMGPIESFPFDAPPEYDNCRERRCPQCGSENGINASCIRFCEKCNERPAVEEKNVSPKWCQECIDGFDEQCEAAYRASQDI